MENIVDYLKLEKPFASDELSKELEEAGFGVAAKIAKIKYPIIKIETIIEYLHKLGDEDVLSWFRKQRISDPSIFRYNANYAEKDWNQLQAGDLYVRTTGDKDSPWQNRRRDIFTIWRETPIAMYRKVPPLHVIQRTKEARSSFEDIRVVTVHIEEVKYPDPLIVGRCPNDENRYLIDWWDKDINVEDLVQHDK